MANGVIVDYGVSHGLTNLVLGTGWSGAKCHLYSNNQTPTDSDVLGNYTEATFTGYSSVTVTWGTVSVTAHVASSVGSTCTFTLTAGSQNIYGMYLTDSAVANLLGACIDPNAPIAMNTTVNVYQVVVTLTLQSAF